jgi:hypothetical protein
MRRKRVAQLAFAAVAALALAAIPLAADAVAQKKGGGSHSMTGCLQKGNDAKMYKLTNVEGTGPKEVEIVGTAKDVDLAPHVGHKVTITGTTVSASAAAKAEGEKDVKKEKGEHHMRITAVKMISATCP